MARSRSSLGHSYIFRRWDQANGHTSNMESALPVFLQSLADKLALPFHMSIPGRRPFHVLEDVGRCCMVAK